MTTTALGLIGTFLWSCSGKILFLKRTKLLTYTNQVRNDIVNTILFSDIFIVLQKQAAENTGGGNLHGM